MVSTNASLLRGWSRKHRNGEDAPAPSSRSVSAHEMNQQSACPPVVFGSPYRSEALSLYRKILRAARYVPTPHRKIHIRRRARLEFQDSRHETDPEQIAFLLQVGETHLDTIQVQGNHLSQQFEDVRYRDWKT